MGPQSVLGAPSSARDLGVGLHAALNVAHQIRRGHVQGVTQSEHHSDARTVAAQLDQRHVVAVHVRAQRQLDLSPPALGAQVSQRLSESLIWFQSLVRKIERECGQVW